jgi:hypothetical protein
MQWQLPLPAARTILDDKRVENAVSSPIYTHRSVAELRHLETAAYIAYVSIRQHTSAYVSIRQHTSAHVSTRQHTSAHVSTRQHTSAHVSIRQHTSAYVSIRQHTSAYVSIRQHTSAYVNRGHLEGGAGGSLACCRTRQGA